MSRATAHSYMEGFGGIDISEESKDLYLNITKPIILSALRPWGSSHIQTNTSSDCVDSVAATAYTQTEYAYPTTNVPMEIIDVAVKYAASASHKTARCVQPFEHGDDIADGFTDQDDPVYFLRNNKIIVYPQFMSIITDAIKVQMVERLSALAETITTTGLSSEGEMLWALKVLEYYLSAINDNKAAIVKTQYNEHLWALKKIAPIGSPNVI